MAQTLRNAQNAAVDAGLGQSFGKIITRATLFLIKAKAGKEDINQVRVELLSLVKDVQSYTGTQFYGQDVVEAVLSFEVPEQAEILIKKTLAGLKAGGEELYRFSLELAKKIMAAFQNMVKRQMSGAQSELFSKFEGNQSFKTFLFLVLILGIALAAKFLKYRESRAAAPGTETVFEDLEQRLSLDTLQEDVLDEKKALVLFVAIAYLTIGILLVAKSKKKMVQLLGAYFCLVGLLSLGVVILGSEERMLTALLQMLRKMKSLVSR